MKENVFGKLTVIKDSGIRKHRKRVWLCRCECGTETLVTTAHLVSGHTTSCGCAKKGKKTHRRVRKSVLNKIGMRVKRLVLIDVKKIPRGKIIAVLRCNCGNQIERDYISFTKGDFVSCGCLSREIKENAKIKPQVTKEIKPYVFKLKKDISGVKLPYVTVLYWCGVRINSTGAKTALWYCQCKCGRYIIRTAGSLNKGSASCGCVFRQERIQRINSLNGKRERERKRKFSEINIQEELTHKNRRCSKTVRKNVFNKYGNRCLICGKEDSTEQPLCIHHLRPHWLYIKLRYFTINNIPLCRTCHDKLHKNLDVNIVPPTRQWDYIKEQRCAMGVTPLLWGRTQGQEIEKIDPPAPLKAFFLPDSVKIYLFTGICMINKQYAMR